MMHKEIDGESSTDPTHSIILSNVVIISTAGRTKKKNRILQTKAKKWNCHSRKYRCHSCNSNVKRRHKKTKMNWNAPTPILIKKSRLDKKLRTWIVVIKWKSFANTRYPRNKRKIQIQFIEIVDEQRSTLGNIYT